MTCNVYIKKENSAGSFDFAVDFRCSIGFYIETEKEKALFVDGRYYAAAKRLLNDDTEILDYRIDNIKSWMKTHVGRNEQVLYEWNEFSASDIERFGLDNYKLSPFDYNAAQKYKYPRNMEELSLEIVGESYCDKFEKIKHVFNECDALLLNDPASIAWLCNIRDMTASPSLMSNVKALIKNNTECTVYDPFYQDNNNIVGYFVVKPIEHLDHDIIACNCVSTDKSDVSSKIARTHSNLIFQENPCLVHKMIKNRVELENIKRIHIQDSIAVTKALNRIKKGMTERQAIEILLEEKRKISGYICESFNTISAADAHSAEIHYNGSDADTPIDNMFLLDAGGQYLGGTTDMTRTICLGPPTSEQIEMYTRVLMGHIDLFLADPKLPPQELDRIARKYLADIGADYAHGTGHGVGYMSDVHEGPVCISAKSSLPPLRPGMVISNEPGYYKVGEYGIRIENLMYIDINNDGNMRFVPLTLVPYCDELIDMNMLNNAQRKWLGEYNAMIKTDR